MKINATRLAWSDFRASPSRSYRRMMLDSFLAATLKDRNGVLVDLGGKTCGRHGNFEPGRFTAIEWINVNLDPESQPQVLADVCDTPLGDACADMLLCSETLEHLKDPAACIREARRLLRPGGTLILSVPFLFPIHADPADYQRFTPQGLRGLLDDFCAVELYPMGGFWGVIGLFLDIHAQKSGPRLWRALLRRAGRTFCWFDSLHSSKNEFTAFTTGCFAVARKPDAKA